MRGILAPPFSNGSTRWDVEVSTGLTKRAAFFEKTHDFQLEGQIIDLGACTASQSCLTMLAIDLYP
ncbi:hypothetical protein L861_06500 [Litchfieldella anticariensis FP35 = DSM 16096]|uniref:Uncharacterized protein n=1 Tax=Litchfieldella anticariensis (strain DSM 16096 / CECT 5854 / CIP 108499 / LMG 22089 / FP35) TaxID=1121939 RepID=S2KYV7_LITA3|nr:hypothetical protein L861_06500 [Halomonas anticariensis FP35 = DSM 16096]